MQESEKKSKRLSFLLRHSALPDANGWVETEVLSAQNDCSIEELEDIVNNDPKGRFAFSEDRSKVRALYGHSFTVNLELKPETPPDVLYHGTSEKFLRIL